MLRARILLLHHISQLQHQLLERQLSQERLGNSQGGTSASLQPWDKGRTRLEHHQEHSGSRREEEGLLANRQLWGRNQIRLELQRQHSGQQRNLGVVEHSASLQR
jgi:hypothetical protein